MKLNKAGFNVPESYSLLKMPPVGCLISALKKAEDRQEVILRLFNPAESATCELEAVFHQNTGESQQIAQDIDQSVDLLSLSEEMPANEDLLNEDSAAPVIRLINAILSEAIKETASDIHIETYAPVLTLSPTLT